MDSLQLASDVCPRRKTPDELVVELPCEPPLLTADAAHTLLRILDAGQTTESSTTSRAS